MRLPDGVKAEGSLIRFPDGQTAPDGWAVDLVPVSDRGRCAATLAQIDIEERGIRARLVDPQRVVDLGGVDHVEFRWHLTPAARA